MFSEPPGIIIIVVIVIIVRILINCGTQGVLTVLFGFFRRDTTTPTLRTGD